jgi:outer membrane protein W
MRFVNDHGVPTADQRCGRRRLGLALLAVLALYPRIGRAQPTAERAPAVAVVEPAPVVLEPRRPSLYVRLGGALVAPVAQSREMELADVQGTASLAVANGPIRGSGASVDSALIPAAIVGYVLPTASRRWSTEVILGLPFTVRFKATGTLADTSIAPMALGIPTGVGPLGSELGEAKAIPIVLTATYRWPVHRLFAPYFGAGPAVMFTSDAKVTNAMLTEVNQPDMTIDPAPGLVLQSGLEARFSKSIYARLDLKFIAFMMARAEVHNVNVKTPGLPLFESVEVGTAKMNVWVNPFIVHASVGFDFDLW